MPLFRHAILLARRRPVPPPRGSPSAGRRQGRAGPPLPVGRLQRWPSRHEHGLIRPVPEHGVRRPRQPDAPTLSPDGFWGAAAFVSLLATSGRGGRGERAIPGNGGGVL